MLIKEPELVSIKENKVTLIKNFAFLERKYDFNLLSQLMEENALEVINKTSGGNLKDVFQMFAVNNCLEEFTTFNDFLRRLLKYERDKKDAVDLFFSFVSQVGNTHVDIEDVFIIGLEGKTIYRVFDNINKDYTIEKGDMIFIPKGIKHKVIGLTPRIIASIGFYGKRMKKL
jgi:mannose-6-phosphate isomerase-like protein (cupin superfamily)